MTGCPWFAQRLLTKQGKAVGVPWERLLGEMAGSRQLSQEAHAASWKASGQVFSQVSSSFWVERSAPQLCMCLGGPGAETWTLCRPKKA